MRLAWGLLLTTACTGISDDPDAGELLAYVDLAADVGISGDDLYVVSGGSESYRVLRMPKHGGTPQVVSQHASVHALTADADGAYWVASDDLEVRLMAFPRGAQSPVELGRGVGFNGYTLRNVATDASHVYFADLMGSVWKADKSGGGMVEIGKTDTSAGSIAIAPDGVWVATLHGAKLLPPSGAPRELVFAERWPDGLSWDAGVLFAVFAGSGDHDGSLVRIDATGTAVALVDNLVLPGGVTSHDGYVYVATGNIDGAIRRVPYAGGGSQAMARGRWPTGLAIDHAYVYWTDWQGDEIRRFLR